MAVSGDLTPPRFYVGTKADLKPGDLIEFDDGHVQFVTTLDAAAWQGELGPGDGPGRIYAVEPTGPVEEAPDPPEYPIPTQTYRSPAPLRVIDECTDAEGRPLRLYHGTKADLEPDDLIQPGYAPNFGEKDRVAKYVYFAGTLDAAIWGAELAFADGPGRIYIVEPTGPFVNDPNLTDQRFPGNPTRSYRSEEPLRVVGEVTAWEGHSPEALQAMKDRLAQLDELGIEPDDD